ncbi:MAG: secondary thiamine-phosphate synthase enzyme YjbQ, partial [Armatimonadota bacterium]
METIEVSTREKQSFHDITRQVQEVVSHEGAADGLCLVFCPHTTAGVTLNENWDASVQHDMGVGLNKISPSRPEYRH